MVRDIKSTAEFQHLIASGRKVVVHFQKPLAEPCRRFVPKFDAFSQDHPETDFVAVDIELLPEVARIAEIEAIPTVKAYQSNRVVHWHVGGGVDDLQYLVGRFD
ncbi:Cytoplasmic thioredoxin isoenzyme 2 [Linnemannia schmuckeri]|uniref:Cytoplasmic thioredoxin isoenzyme 2 n=1 Tax=Linnemannia schmuckeri TaxID=64567 RepID=A0A9P5RT40_9FUNG|nr:Cytoplasmic thioredoxin isoenzyme 2 [Linnemannia schmuckeri]